MTELINLLDASIKTRMLDMSNNIIRNTFIWNKKYVDLKPICKEEALLLYSKFLLGNLDFEEEILLKKYSLTKFFNPELQIRYVEVSIFIYFKEIIINAMYEEAMATERSEQFIELVKMYEHFKIQSFIVKLHNKYCIIKNIINILGLETSLESEKGYPRIILEKKKEELKEIIKTAIVAFELEEIKLNDTEAILNALKCILESWSGAIIYEIPISSNFKGNSKYKTKYIIKKCPYYAFLKKKLLPLTPEMITDVLPTYDEVEEWIQGNEDHIRL